MSVFKAIRLPVTFTIIWKMFIMRHRKIVYQKDFMDKEQTKDLLRTLHLILIGTFFWLIRPNIVSSFFTSVNYPFQLFCGLEIIGTVLILIATLIVFFVFPFQYSLISVIVSFSILVLNVLDFFLYKNPVMQVIHSYLPVLMSVMLHFASRLMQVGMRHFGAIQLSRTWKTFSVLIIFAFSVPYYIFITAKYCNLIVFPTGDVLQTFLAAMIPAIVLVTFCFTYYGLTLVKSIKYLLQIQKRYKIKYKY